MMHIYPDSIILVVVNEFSNIAGYKINTQVSVVFLYINNEVAEREIKKTTPFTIAPERIKYLARDELNQRGDKPVLWKP